MTGPRRMLSRLAALALPIGLAMLVLTGWVLPVLDETDRLEHALAAEHRLAGELRTRAAGREEAEATRDALRAHQGESPVFLTGATGPVAAAALQTRLSEAADALGAITVSAGGGHDPVGEDGLQRITAEIVLRAPIDRIAALLARIEGDRPLLFVERLAISAPLETRGRDVASPRVIGAEIAVEGYRIAGSDGGAEQ